MEDLKSGDLINERYSLIQFLGSGTFGEVWLAHDRLANRDVALKIYLNLNPTGVQEFRNEYSNTADLSSPYLLTTDHFDVYGRRPFLVMKYCNDGSAMKYAGDISEDRLWQFIHDVAKGLEVLHGQSDPIIHQDIKPDNILIDDKGRFLITDFGISKRLRATLHRQSQHSTSSGSIPYMAPERFEAQPKLKTASDIWSLGASIYELATGELPFNGFGGSMQSNGAQMPSISDRVSPALDSLMQQCLDPDPYKRPTAQELSQWATTRNVPIGAPTLGPGATPTPTLPAGTAPTPTVAAGTGATPSPTPTVKVDNPEPKKKNNNKAIIVAAIAIISATFLAALYFERTNNNSNNITGMALARDSVNESVEIDSQATALGNFDQGEVDTIDLSSFSETPQIDPVPIKRNISIHELDYNAHYSVTASKGSISVVQTLQGEQCTYELKTNPNVDLSRILDQFEGLVYFWAASDTGSNIVNENGSYSDEYLLSTIRLLSKSQNAFGSKRGNSPIAYDGAKSRKDMLTECRNRTDEDALSKIETIAWGMGEHPVTTKDIKLDY